MCVLSVTTAVAGQVPASDAAALQTALQLYRDQDVRQGTASLIAIPLAKLERSVRDLARVELQARRFEKLEVAALALTESAVASMNGPAADWRVRKGLASDLGRQLLASGDSSRALRAWGLADEALDEGLRDFESAQKLLANLRRVFPDDGEVLFASGSAYETQAYSLVNSELPYGRDLSEIPTSTKRNSAGFNPSVGQHLEELDRSDCLRRARDYYRAALGASPGLVESRVRLARVLHQLGDLAGAVATLDALGVQSASPELMYLSRLFRAAIEEDLGHLDKAKNAYLEAMEWRAHAPFVGLAALLRSSGDGPAATAVVDRLLSDAPEFDPWWSYLKGQGSHITDRLDAARKSLR